VNEGDLFKLHQAHAKEAATLRYGRGRPRHWSWTTSTGRHTLADDVERHVYEALRALGYDVCRQGHNSRFDILVDGRLRVEVKASRWHANGTRGRYQALFHNRADVVVFCPVNGKVHHFLIPSGELSGPTNLAIWSHDPARYGGQWATWFERWDTIAAALEGLGPRWVQGRLL
jgi:hypothetical protein